MSDQVDETANRNYFGTRAFDENDIPELRLTRAISRPRCPVGLSPDTPQACSGYLLQAEGVILSITGISRTGTHPAWVPSSEELFSGFQRS